MAKFSLAEARDYVAQLTINYRSGICKYLLSLMDKKNYDDAEDVTQETFLRAYIHVISKRNEIQHPWPWLCSIAKNCYSRFVSNRNLFTQSMFSNMSEEEEVFMDTPDPQTNLENLLIAKDLEGAITEEVEALTPSLKKVMDLAKRGYTPTQISEVLHQPPSTTRAYLARARKVVQSKISPDE